MNVLVVFSVATVPEVAGNVIVVPSVPAKVKVLLIWRVLDVVPPAIEKPVDKAVSVSGGV